MSSVARGNPLQVLQQLGALGQRLQQQRGLLGDGGDAAAKLGQVEIKRCAALERRGGAGVLLCLDRLNACSLLRLVCPAPPVRGHG